MLIAVSLYINAIQSKYFFLVFKNIEIMFCVLLILIVCHFHRALFPVLGLLYILLVSFTLNVLE